MIRITGRRIRWEVIGLAATTLAFGSCAGRQAQRIEWIEGTLESDEVDVSAKVPGCLTEVLLEEGSPVRVGDVVARLESKEIDAKVAQASGAYEAAMAKREQAAQAVKLQKLTVENQIRQAEGACAAAKARLEMALNGATSGALQIPFSCFISTMTDRAGGRVTPK